MATASRLPEPHESPGESLERAVEASRELVTDAIRLARLEAVAAARRTLGAMALLAAASALFALAWIAGAVALAMVLTRWLVPAGAVGCVALLHLVLAVAGLAWARRRAESREAS